MSHFPALVVLVTVAANAPEIKREQETKVAGIGVITHVDLIEVAGEEPAVVVVGSEGAQWFDLDLSPTKTVRFPIIEGQTGGYQVDSASGDGETLRYVPVTSPSQFNRTLRAFDASGGEMWRCRPEWEEESSYAKNNDFVDVATDRAGGRHIVVTAKGSDSIKVFDADTRTESEVPCRRRNQAETTMVVRRGGADWLLYGSKSQLVMQDVLGDGAAASVEIGNKSSFINILRRSTVDDRLMLAGVYNKARSRQEYYEVALPSHDGEFGPVRLLTEDERAAAWARSADLKWPQADGSNLYVDIALEGPGVMRITVWTGKGEKRFVESVGMRTRGEPRGLLVRRGEGESHEVLIAWGDRIALLRAVPSDGG